jgi:hypothetical protein
VRQSRDTPEGKLYSITPIKDLKDKTGASLGACFGNDTPLWFYILAEAQRPIVDFWIENGRKDLTENQLKGLDVDGTTPLADTRCTGTQLGGVGGRIVAEVFYGLLESDDDSVLRSGRKPSTWHPVWGAGPATIPKLLKYLDPGRAPQ